MFNAGDDVIIGYGTAQQESNTIASIGSIILTTPLQYTHAAGVSFMMSSSAVAGSDPMTRYKGKTIKFWLPNFELVPLLRTRHLSLHGSTFPGESCVYQWFERFVISEPSGHPIVKVSVKRGILPHASSRMGLFEQLDITLRDEASPMVTLDRPIYGDAAGAAYQDYSLQNGNVRVRVGRQYHHPPRVNSPFYEYVYVESPELSFIISPAHAANEYPDDASKALEYSHVDMFIMDMSGEESFLGILPEIWGVTPLSEEVEAFTQPPEDETCSSAFANDLKLRVPLSPLPMSGSASL